MLQRNGKAGIWRGISEDSLALPIRRLIKLIPAMKGLQFDESSLDTVPFSEGKTQCHHV